jgi:hypothetical protein
MSASRTWLPPLAPSIRKASSAPVALRRGRNPNELSQKLASKTGSTTSFVAIWTTRSRTAGMPSGLLLPSAFGMYRLSTALGRYRPSRSSAPSSPRKRSTPYCSTSTSVWASTPAEPRLALTRFHASSRTSLRKMRSYSAWKRRPGSRLAATHSRRWSCRTLSGSFMTRGWLARLAGMPSRLPPPTARSPQGPFPTPALCCAGIDGTTTPSDSRCAATAFAFGLCGAPGPDEGGTDGSLVFRTSP